MSGRRITEQVRRHPNDDLKKSVYATMQDALETCVYELCLTRLPRKNAQEKYIQGYLLGGKNILALEARTFIGEETGRRGGGH